MVLGAAFGDIIRMETKKILGSLPGHGNILNPYGPLSLKMQNVEFDITVPPCKLYVKNLTAKISMRLYNSVQMSFQH